MFEYAFLPTHEHNSMVNSFYIQGMLSFEMLLQFQ